MKFKNQNEYLCENIVDWADESWIISHIISFINKNLTFNSALKFWQTYLLLSHILKII